MTFRIWISNFIFLVFFSQSLTAFAAFGLYKSSALDLFGSLSADEDRVVSEYLKKVVPGAKLHLLPDLLQMPSVNEQAFYRHLQGDVNSERSADVLVYLQSNRAAIERALSKYREHLLTLPEGERSAMKSQFLQVKSVLKNRKIPFPSIWRSLTAITLFVAADDLAYSFFSSFIFPSNEYVWAGLISNARKLIGLFTVCAIAYDLVTLKGSVKALVDRYIVRFKSLKTVNRFIQTSIEVKQSKDILRTAEFAHKSVGIDIQDTARVLSKLLAGADKQAQEDLSKSKWVRIVSRYIRTNRVNRVMKEVAKNLSPIELQQINDLFLDKGIEHRFEVKQSHYRAQIALVKDFKDWMTSDPEIKKINLVAAYDEFSRTTLNKYLKTRKVSTPLKMSMVGFTGFLTIGGLYAAFGNDARLFDLPYYDLFRTHGWTLAIASGLIGNAFLGIQLIVRPFYKQNGMELMPRRSPPSLSKGDWSLVRKSIEIASKELGQDPQKPSTESSTPASQFMEKSIEKYFGSNTYFLDYYRAGMCEAIVSQATRL